LPTSGRYSRSSTFAPPRPATSAPCTGSYQRYGLTIPDNSHPGKVTRYPSLTAACEAGIEAEIVNGEMYTRLMATNPRPDILTVLRNLQAASQQRHLPAFRRCAQRATDATGCADGAAATHDGPRQRRRGRAGRT